MIYKGKIVDIKPGQPEKIQKKINVVDAFKDDIKSEEIPRVEHEGGGDLEFQGLGFNIFENENSEYQERKTRYDYFREMAASEIINRALEIVADDASQFNDLGDVIEIETSDENIKQRLNELFERLDMNNELWSIFFETIKMGDNFYEVIVDDYKSPKKIIHIKHLDAEKIERVEKNGTISYFSYKETKLNKITGNKEAEKIYRFLPWQIIHFKIESKEFKPYGLSLLNTAIKTFRRLSLLEDIMVVYRISRAPERRVFYVDVGRLNKVETERYIAKLKNIYRSQNYIDENGNINKKAHILSLTSDMFVPVREGSQGTRIETLQGGEALHNIDDVKFFYSKILRTMNIPPAYMGDEADRSRGSLAQLDIKFSKFVERIQAHIIRGLNKLAALELFFNRENKDSLSNFKISLTRPSNIKEITEIDLQSQKYALLQSMQSVNIFSNEFLLRNVLKFSEKEITDIIMHKNLTGQQGEGGEEGGAGGGALPPDLGGAAGGGETPDLPPEGEAPLPPENQEYLPTETELIESIGKDFVVKNQKDFFIYYKLLREHLKNRSISNNTIINESAKLFSKATVFSNNNNVQAQIYLQEFAGLDLDNKKSFSLYEEVEDGEDKRFKKKKIILN